MRRVTVVDEHHPRLSLAAAGAAETDRSVKARQWPIVDERLEHQGLGPGLPRHRYLRGGGQPAHPPENRLVIELHSTNPTQQRVTQRRHSSAHAPAGYERYL